MKCINKKCGAEIPDGSVYCNICGKKQIKEPRKNSKRPNGTGTAYKRGKAWTSAVVIGYTNKIAKDGKKRRVPIYRTKGGFETKTAALDYCSKLKEAPAKNTPKLEELWEAWSTSDMTKLSGSKRTAYTIAHNKLLKTDIAFRQIDTLRMKELQEALSSQCETFYTARDFKNLLSKLYQRAMADEDVKSNLAQLLTLPDLIEEEPEPFNELEQQKLWNEYTAGDMIAGYILLMIYTGMMPGELMGCQKTMIDWEGFNISGAGKKTKTRKQTPIIFPDIIEPVLRNLCDYSKGKKLLTMNRDNFYAEYYLALERAGCRRLTPYSCRHTTGTALAKEKLPMSTVQKIMRHAKYQSTQRYIHTDVSDMREAINAIGKIPVAK